MFIFRGGYFSFHYICSVFITFYVIMKLVYDEKKSNDKLIKYTKDTKDTKDTDV